MQNFNQIGMKKGNSKPITFRGTKIKNFAQKKINTLDMECDSVSSQSFSSQDPLSPGHADIHLTVNDEEPRELATELKNWALHNKVSHNTVDDLLKRLTNCGIVGIPSTAQELFHTDSDGVLNEILKEIKTLRTENQELKKTLLENSTKLNEIEEKLVNDEYDQITVASGKNGIMTPNQRVHNMIKDIAYKNNDDTLYIKSLFPIKSMLEMEEVEQHICNPVFATKLTSYLQKFDDVNTMIKFAAIDEFYIQFNLKGLAGKNALTSLKLFDDIMFSVSGMDKLAYEKELRSCLLKAHNRYYKIGKYPKKVKISDSD